MEKKVISLEEATKILCHNVVSIKKHVKLGNLPKFIKSDGDVLGFDEEELAGIFNLSSIKEPFIQVSEASKVLDMSYASVVSRCASKINPIPHFKIEDKRGAKLLFLKSGLEEWMKFKLVISPGFNNSKRKYQTALDLLNVMLDMDDEVHFLTEMEVHVFRFTYIENITFAEIGSRLDLTREGVRQIFNRAFRKIRGKVYQLSKTRKKFDELTGRISEMEVAENIFREENRRLVEENNELRRQLLIPGIPNLSSLEIKGVFGKSLRDFDLSVRALNSLYPRDIKTLGDLVTYTENDLLKFRGFGRKCVNEVEDLLKSENLRLGMKLEDFG